MPNCVDPEREAQRRAKVADAARKRWQDPEYRERVSARIRATSATAESRARRSAASKAQWSDPAVRAKHVEALVAAHEDGRMGDYGWLKGLSGQQTSQWTGDAVGYRAAHARIANTLGKASEHECVDCGREAAEWSIISRVGHSPRVEDYEPRCVRCHRRYDRAAFSS